MSDADFKVGHRFAAALREGMKPAAHNAGVRFVLHVSAKARWIKGGVVPRWAVRKGRAQGKVKVSKTAKTTVARADDRCVADLAACEHPEQAVSSGNIPTEVIAAMVAAGAKEAKEKRVDGQDLRVLQVDSVQSEAWSMYEGWASSLGKIDPMVQAHFLPPPAMQRTPVCPPLVLGTAIQDEANSIVYHFAPLHIEDFEDGIPALLAAAAPLAARQPR